MENIKTVERRGKPKGEKKKENRVQNRGEANREIKTDTENNVIVNKHKDRKRIETKPDEGKRKRKTNKTS